MSMYVMVRPSKISTFSPCNPCQCLPGKGLQCTEPRGHIKDCLGKNTTPEVNSMPLKMDIPVEVGRLSTIICRVLMYPGGCLGFLNHQQSHLKMDGTGRRFVPFWIW